MGSYGIGVERVMSAAVELYNDDAGISWPMSIAPFHVVLTVVNVKDQGLLEAATQVYEELQNAGVDVLLDDRDERAGVKFNDADLIGIPYRVTFGKKVKEGKVELFTRATRTSEDLESASVVQVIRARLQKSNS